MINCSVLLSVQDISSIFISELVHKNGQDIYSSKWKESPFLKLEQMIFNIPVSPPPSCASHPSEHSALNKESNVQMVQLMVLKEPWFNL